MGDVTKIYPNGAADPDAVLEQAIGNYKTVILIGWTPDGEFDVRSTSDLDIPHMIYALEKLKHNLLNGDYGAD